MANLKLSQLTDGGNLTSGDLILASKGAVSNSILAQNAASSLFALTSPATTEGAEINTGQSLAAGTDIYTGKSGSTLQFRGLVGGNNVTLAASGTDITINSSLPLTPVPAEVTAGRVLTINDLNAYLRVNNAASQTMTVPPNVDVSFAIGSQVHFEQTGAGAVAIAPGAGVTVNHAGSTPNATTRAQFSGITIIKTATDVWTAHGDLVTA